MPQNDDIKKQFKNDADTWMQYLENAHSKQSEVVKRIFLMMDNLKYRNHDSEHYQSVAEKNTELLKNNQTAFPLAATLSHGGRVVIQIPPLQPGDDKNAFLKWVTGQNEITASSKDATAENPVFYRPAATHSLDVRKEKITPQEIQHNETDKKVIELKVHPNSPKDLSRFAADYANHRHIGFNVALHGQKEDGSHGHVYMYWLAPTEKSPGGLMVGVEGSEPGKSNAMSGGHHGMSGKSSDMSATGSKKFRDFDNSYAIKPDAIDGLRVDLSTAEMKTLMLYTTNDFDIKRLQEPIMTIRQDPEAQKELALKHSESESTNRMMQFMLQNPVAKHHDTYKSTDPSILSSANPPTMEEAKKTGLQQSQPQEEEPVVTIRPRR